MKGLIEYSQDLNNMAAQTRHEWWKHQWTSQEGGEPSHVPLYVTRQLSSAEMEEPVFPRDETLISYLISSDHF